MARGQRERGRAELRAALRRRGFSGDLGEALRDAHARPASSRFDALQDIHAAQCEAHRMAGLSPMSRAFGPARRTKRWKRSGLIAHHRLNAGVGPLAEDMSIETRTDHMGSAWIIYLAHCGRRHVVAMYAASDVFGACQWLAQLRRIEAGAAC